MHVACFFYGKRPVKGDDRWHVALAQSKDGGSASYPTPVAIASAFQAIKKSKATGETVFSAHCYKRKAISLSTLLRNPTSSAAAVHRAK